MIFKNSNVVITLNDNALGFIQNILIEDVKTDTEAYTKITLQRYVGNTDGELIIDDLRFSKFGVKMFNTDSLQGYVSNDAEFIGFSMRLSTAGKEQFLLQELVIKAHNFIYTMKVGADLAHEDYKSLIELLKNRTRKEDAPKAQMPTEKTQNPIKNPKDASQKHSQASSVVIKAGSVKSRKK